MAKRGNGLGGTPVEIPRTGRANTWGVRTPLHFNKATGKQERYWIAGVQEQDGSGEGAPGLDHRLRGGQGRRPLGHEAG